MKCANCEKEWFGDGVICAQCRQSNDIQDEIAHPALNELPSGNAAISDKAVGRKNTVRTAQGPKPVNGVDANLIQFPRTSGQSGPADGDSESMPTWRTEVREKVRQFRAQRAAVVRREEEESAIDLPANPIIEAALKRLQRPPEEAPERTTRPLPKPGTDHRESPEVGALPVGAGANPVYPPTESVKPLVTAPAVDADVKPAATAIAVTEKALKAEPVFSDRLFLDEADDISDARLLPAKARRKASSGANVRNAGSFESSQAGDNIIPSTVKHSAKIITADDDGELYPLPAPVSTTSGAQVSLSKRAMAWVTDIAIVLLLSAPLLLIDSFYAALKASENAYLIPAGLAWISFCYYTLTFWAGCRTCGMAWQGIKAVQASIGNGRISALRAMVRALGSTAALFAPPINWLFIWVSGNQSSLADIVSGTMIVPEQ
jgi:hypothetical protein